MKIIAAKSLLKANDQRAAENRALLQSAGVVALNMVGSPGAGKTSLLEALFAALKDRIRPMVIEGDIAGSIDAERMMRLGVPVVQINTDGACHLDANMVAAALHDIDCDRLDLVAIENVGNLVCTAAYDLGERLRVVVLSTSEGDDKLVKYPAIFQGADALVVTKMDLLPYLNFDLQRVAADLKRLAPQAELFPVAALTGDGIPAAADWLASKCGELKAEKRE